MKIIQLNIFLGAYLDNLSRFLVEEKPDAVTMQEVTQEAFNIISSHVQTLRRMSPSCGCGMSDRAAGDCPHPRTGNNPRDEG